MNVEALAPFLALLELARYTVLNPVRAKMVERPEDYAWSSYRATVGLEAAPAWLTTSWLLAQFSSSPLRYRNFVDAGVGLERSPWDDLQHQIFLGSAQWLERMRGWVESQERSVEIPRTQRCIARPGVEAVIETVAEAMEIEPNDIVEGRGGLARTLVAHLAFREGLVRLREIAQSLTLRSSGHISNLVRRARDEIEQHRDVAAVAEQCLARLRPATIALA